MAAVVLLEARTWIQAPVYTLNTVPTFIVKLLKRGNQRNLRGTCLLRILFLPLIKPLSWSLICYECFLFFHIATSFISQFEGARSCKLVPVIIETGCANRLYFSAKTVCQFFFEICVFTFLVSAFSSETDINISNASFHSSKQVSASSNITLCIGVHFGAIVKCIETLLHIQGYIFETFQYWNWWHLYLYLVFNLFKAVLMFVFHCLRLCSEFEIEK